MAEPNDPTERPSFERRPKKDPQNFRPPHEENQPSKFAKRPPQEPDEEQDVFFANDVDNDLDVAPESEESESSPSRRPYQDFPELRTLRRWSILSRWYWRNCKQVLQFWEWDLQEGLQTMSNWRPTQRGLWRFSTMTGVISLLLTLLLFWQFKHNKSIEPLTGEMTAAIAEETEPEILQTDSRAPEFSPPTVAMTKTSEEDALALLDDGKKRADPPMEEEEKPSAEPPAASYNFDDEPVVEPRKPQLNAPQIDEPKVEPKLENPPKKEEDVQSEIAEPVATQMPPAAEELEWKPREKKADPPAFPEKEENKFEPPEETPDRAKPVDEDFAPPPVKSKATETRIQSEEEPKKEEEVQSETVDPITIKTPPANPEEKEDKPAEEPAPTPPPQRKIDLKNFPARPSGRIAPEPVENRQPEPQPVNDVTPIRENPPAVLPPAAPAQPKVVITRTGNWLPLEPSQGPLAVYSMTLKNQFNSDLNNLRIEETLPPGTKFKSASQGGVYNAVSHSVSWKLTNLPVGGTTSLSVTVNPQVMTAQSSRIQVISGADVIGRGSWTVTHSCPPTAATSAPPVTGWTSPPAYHYAEEIREAVYEW